jgi:RNA polymerase sigma-70 factor, ECF subfamily
MEAAAWCRNERSVIADVCRGNRDAFSVLFNHYGRKLYRVAFRILRNREDAEDVVQTAMLKAYSRLPQFRGDSQFSTWLMRITINEALMKLRKRNDEHFVPFDELGAAEINQSFPSEIKDAALNPEEDLLATELLMTSIRDLSSCHTAAFLLHNVQGFTVAEVAQALRISAAAAKSRVFRARLHALRNARKVLHCNFFGRACVIKKEQYANADIRTPQSGSAPPRG